MRKIIWVSFFMLFPVYVQAQVVTTNPDILEDQEALTITFYADEGNAGLEDYTEDVYAHTGVITNKSNSGSDWKYVIAEWGQNIPKAKLTRQEPNVYTLSITPSVRQFYGVPDNEIIEEIALVFRNDDGTKEGKDTGGEDIFIDVSQPGLSLKFTHPQNNTVLDTNETVTINVAANEHDSIELYIDDLLTQTTTNSVLTDMFSAELSKVYTIKAIAYSQNETFTDSIFIFVKGEIPEEPLPSNATTGIEYINSNTVRVVLFAPEKEMIFVLGDFNNWLLSNDFLMKKDGDFFWLEIADLTPGKEYAFQYYIDNEIYIADPYTQKILDPWNDKYISEQTYPDLKAYPDGQAQGIVSVFQTNQPTYQWQNDFIAPDAEDLIIYELLLRDFIAAHDWKTLTDSLDYLTDLGINAIELMPFNEFEGNESWGYNPSFYFAPDKYYGPANDLKAFIDSCHGRGIAVIQDIVFNHSYGQSPLVKMYWNEDAGRPAANNPWYNETSPNNAFSWGYDFDHDSKATREFVTRASRFWLEEYRIDGYRFDFTKGFTNTEGDGSAYDASRIAILKGYADSIRKTHPGKYIILEHFAPNSEEKVLVDYGMMVWGNINYNFNEAVMGYHNSGKSNFSWAYPSERDLSAPYLVSYMESHDEERLMHKAGLYGAIDNKYNMQWQMPLAIERVALSAVFYGFIPGPRMIWQFGELGYDFSIDYNGRVGNKPIRWDYYDDPHRRILYETYKNVFGFRKQYPDYTEEAEINLSVSDTIKTVEYKHDSFDLKLIGNFAVRQQTYTGTVTGQTQWYDYISGETINISDNEYILELNPSEYRILVSKPPQQSWSVPPRAKNVVINGEVVPGSILTGSYSYFDANGDAEGTSRYQWYRSVEPDGTDALPVEGATELTYNVTNDDDDYYLFFEAIPVAETGTVKTGFPSYAYVDDLVGVKVPDEKTGQLFIYPNPVRNNFTMHLPNKMEGPITLTFYDLNGRSINERSIMLNGNEKEIELSLEEIYLNSPGSLCLIHLQSNSNVYNGKILID
ncbi:MAG: alpha-amylase [Bacteroidetes bacterium]|jgi:glycosidase|nr:alpha-amylase [Bacteroidota bacterium]